jgi:GntR family transcriptional regulator / MocR family aminotransferase
VQLQIPLVSSAGPLFRQVYGGLRHAILSGALRGGEKLPSTRDLAQQLDVSRTVVLLAYEQLVSEGFAVGRRGSGTYISSGTALIKSASVEETAQLRLARFGSRAAAAHSKVSFPDPQARPLPYDFAYGRSDLETFPLAAWRRILLKCVRTASAAALDYGPASGDSELRESIAAHLRRARAVSCDPSQVIVVNGSQQALDLIARVLIERGDSVGVEDPSYQGVIAVLRAAGARILPVPVDREGLDTARLPKGVRVMFVTPSHQFPTGAILPLSRRLALLEWARRCNAALVEDDYDGEFRYDGQPLESLQGLDRDSRVIYVGTFSRTMFSALRMGYLVAPRSLVPAFTTAKWLCDRHTPRLEQRALAEFISSGQYERYLRRARRRSATRREVLLDSIDRYLKDRVEVAGDGAGAHVVLWSKERIVEDMVITAAASRGVGVYGITPYRLTPAPQSGLMLGYSRLTETQIREGIRRLSKVF